MARSLRPNYDAGEYFQAASSNPITLRDVVDLRVPVQWPEAIAVVEALCDRLRIEYPDLAHVPELADILITSRGTVMIRRGAASDQELDGLGHTLHALLDPATTPVPLRLFVTHAVGAGKYSSVGEFADALAYYARPEREELITMLYGRCLEAPVPALEPAQPANAPVNEPEAEEKKTRRQVPRWLPVAAVVLVGVLSAVAVYSLGQSDPTVQSSLSSVKSAVASVTSAVRQSLGVPADAEPPAIELDDAVPADQAATPRVAANRRSSPARSRAATVTSSPTGRAGEGARAEIAAQSSLPATSYLMLEDTPIYSTAAVDVRPPILFSPKLPPVPPSQGNVPGTNTMELLIDETGQVEKVRLLSKPVRMPDMMMLGNAKTWRFHPATKNGRPVRYQLAFSWVATVP